MRKLHPLGARGSAGIRACGGIVGHGDGMEGLVCGHDPDHIAARAHELRHVDDLIRYAAPIVGPVWCQYVVARRPAIDGQLITPKRRRRDRRTHNRTRAGHGKGAP